MYLEGRGEVDSFGRHELPSFLQLNPWQAAQLLSTLKRVKASERITSNCTACDWCNFTDHLVAVYSIHGEIAHVDLTLKSVILCVHNS